MDEQLHMALNEAIDLMEDVANAIAYMSTSTSSATGDEADKAGQQVILSLLEIKIRKGIESASTVVIQVDNAPS